MRGRLRVGKYLPGTVQSSTSGFVANEALVVSAREATRPMATAQSDGKHPPSKMSQAERSGASSRCGDMATARKLSNEDRKRVVVRARD